MKKLFSILFIALIFSNSCNNSPSSSFEDTLPQFTLKTSVVPEGGGTVHPSEGEFATGDGVEIEARPADGFVFERWGGDLSGNENPERLVFTRDRQVTAHFVERNFNLNIEISGQGFVRETIIDQGDEDSDSPTVVQLEAIPDDGWVFDRWEGDLTGSDNPETITVDSEKNVTAVFDRDVSEGFTINIEIEGEGRVEKDPDRSNFAEGDEVTLTAIAESGWAFIEWQGDLSGTDNSQTITITQDIEATAVFSELEDPALEILSQPGETVAGNALNPAPEVKYTDELGSPIEGAEIDVTLNQNSFTSGSTTTAVTNSGGVAVFDNLIIETASTGYVLIFSADNSDVSDNSSVPFEVKNAEGSASNSSAEVPDGNVGEPTDITITIHDEFDNPVPGVAGQISVSISGANSASPSVSESGDGEYTASYTPTSSGVDQVRIELNGQAISGSPYSSEAGPGLPSELIITEQPNSVIAGNILSPAPEVRVEDLFGNRLEDVEITAELDGGDFAPGSSTTAKSNSNGVAEFDNLEIRTAKTGYTILFKVDDITTRSESFNVSAASVEFSSISADVPDGETGQRTRIEITLQDRFGNAVGGSADKLAVNVSGANSASPSVDETNTTGQYRARYTPVSIGTDRIDIRFENNSINGSPFNSRVEAADASPSRSAVSADPTTLQADEFSTVTVDVRDENGNPIGGLGNSSFGISLTGEASAGSISETSNAGTYRFDVTSSAVETVTVTVAVNGITLADEPEITFEVGDPHEIIITVQPDDTESGEPIEGPPTVRVFDEGGRPVPDVNVRVREQNDTEFSSGTLNVRTNASGTAVFDDLVIESTLGFFNLVFSVDGVDDATSNRFRVSQFGFSTE